MVPQTAEVFMREPALEVENEIGFDFTAAPFSTSPLMEVCKNMQEIKLKEIIPLPAFVCSGKITNDLPQMGLEEILYEINNYFIYLFTPTIPKVLTNLQPLKTGRSSRIAVSGGLKESCDSLQVM
ncbi:hypothetical protein TNIN_146091 [Trichonephila inaurata madagascariensis]|uniref:Uncharacterized protein n=1 Tax=Trichonephila inaurata madagascariensis TaxID=2747483 RepID=A0A8X6YZH7_9ARAC|nr:hypothetical protein TNIN_146091 [Trichonephila inaurata madagascariensis]